MKYFFYVFILAAFFVMSCDDTATNPTNTSGLKGTLYFSNGGEISKFSFGDNTKVLIAENAFQPFVHNQTLYAIEQTPKKKIVRMTLSGSNRETIIESEGDKGPLYKYYIDKIQVSPDGKYIAYEGDAIYNPQSYIITNELNAELVVTLGDYDARQPLISPTWDKSGNLYMQGWKSMNNGIYKLNSDFSEIVRFDPNLSNVEFPMVSPDGKTLAFVKDSKLFTMDLNTKNIKEYEINLQNIMNPFWSPDSKYIAFNSNYAIYALDINTLTYVEVKGVFADRGQQFVWTN